MKAMRIILSLALLVATLGSTIEARAQAGLDPRTRDVLIEKFTRVYMGLAPNDASRTAVTLRLADLHSERARLQSLDELNAGCVTCVAGREDRLKALSYYKEVLPKVPDSALPKVLTQVGHLYEMTGGEKEAIATYQKIIETVKAPEIVTEAHLALGEIHFKKRRFSEAKSEYAKVVAAPKSPGKGLAAYRLAWCEFNDGKLESAINSIVTILRSPELLTRTATADGAQVDKQFQEEVSHDLATFLARRPLTVKDAELLYELSPENARLGHSTYLATEAERLGQVGPAVALWRFTIERQPKPELRLEAHVHLAQLEMAQKLLADAVKDFETALRLWSQLGACPAKPQDGDCKELKSRIRNFVTDWNRVEKKQASEELLKAYQAYLKVFPDEPEMSIWAGKAALDCKQYALSVDLYVGGANLEAGSQTKEASERIEAGLLGAIDAAESSKHSALTARAYDHYIAQSRQKTKLLEVRYQRAHITYEKGDHKVAAEELRAVALSTEPGPANLKKQAADLSLDSLVLLKDDQRVESWSRKYSEIFTGEARGEFASISRKSVLTQTAAEAASANAGPVALAAAWETLKRFDASGASADEKATYLKNKLILAEKLEKFGEARAVADDLLRLPNLVAADREYALSRKAWLAELVLDFDSALSAAEKTTGATGDQKWLKLAMYAELAAKDPKPFYLEYLKGSKDEEKNAAIAAQLVREAKEPMKELERSKAALLKRPNVIAELYMEIFAKDFSPAVAKAALSIPAVAASPGGKAIARSLFLAEVAQLRLKVQPHKVDSSSQKKLAQSLKARVAMLADIEKAGTKAVTGGDWTSQLVILDLLAKESGRFYEEVLSLPVPQGLSGEDEQQYLSLLSQQAAPHQIRAQDVGKKVSEFWASETGLKQLGDALAQSSGAPRKLMSQEASALAEIAPVEKKTTLAAMTSPEKASADATPRPAMAELEKARSVVRENPLGRSGLESLLVLERKLGRKPMIAYLENRIQALPADPAGGKL